MRLSKPLLVFYGALFFYLIVLQSIAAWPFTIDDAYISLRYAKHLSLGHGLVWNINEGVIEGYSNFLYVLIGALFIKLKLNPVIALKAISLMGLITSAIGVYLISRLWLHRALALLAPAILLFYPGEILWSVSGLETTFYQALIIFSVYALLRHHSILSGLLLTLASLTRVEGPMMCLCFICALVMGMLIEKEQRVSLKQSALYLFLSFTISYLPYCIWHYAYFHQLFANPVYCKAFNAKEAGLKLDLAYLILIYPIIIVAIPFLRKRLNTAFLLLVLPSLFYLIALFNADWIVGFLNRHFLTAFSLLCPIFILSLHHLFSSDKLKLSESQIKKMVIVTALAAGFGLWMQSFYLTQYRQFAKDADEGSVTRQKVSHWLNQHLTKHDNIALGDCGLIPYFYHGEVIDTYCLNSLAMKQKAIHYDYQRYSQWLLQSKKPRYIALVQEFSQNKILMPPTDLILYKSQQFHQDYEQVKIIALGKANQSYQYMIYKKNIT